MAELTINHIDSTCAVATSQSTVITVWHGVPTEAAMERAHRAMAQLGLIMSRRGKIGFINVIAANSPQPSDKVRSRAQEMLSDKTSIERVAGLAVIAEGDGVKGFVVRNIMRGLLSFVSLPMPLEIFKDVPQGAAWLATKVNSGQSNFATDLSAAVQDARRRIEALTIRPQPSL